MATRRINQNPRENQIVKLSSNQEAEDFLKNKITELRREVAQLKKENEILKSNGTPKNKVEEEIGKLNAKTIILETELKNSQSIVKDLREKLKQTELEKEKTEKELDAASKRVAPLQKSLEETQAKNKELKEAVSETTFPEEIRISKIGKYMIEEDGTIFIACKVKTTEDGPLETTTLCGNLVAFTTLQEKAQAASNETEEEDNG